MGVAEGRGDPVFIEFDGRLVPRGEGVDVLTKLLPSSTGGLPQTSGVLVHGTDLIDAQTDVIDARTDLIDARAQ